MFAPVLDLYPNQTTTGPARRELVMNTPAPKGLKRRGSAYSFNGGFYQSEKQPVTNPMKELIDKATFARINDLINRFNAVLPNFDFVETTVLSEAISKLATMLLNEPFSRFVIEKTPDNSLLVKADWRGKDVFIDVDFEADEESDYDVLISVYDGMTSVLSVAGPFDFSFGRLLSLNQ